jgi:hypothetical protein
MKSIGISKPYVNATKIVVSMTEYFFSILKTPDFWFFRPQAFDNNPKTGEK